MSNVIVITPPAPLFTVDVAKQHLMEDADDNDALIASFIAAATGHLDGPEGWLGRALGEQVLELRTDRFDACSALRLPCPPLIAVTSIAYDDPAGDEQILTAGSYEFGRYGVRMKSRAAWPVATCAEESVRIRYRAGYDGVAVAEGGTGLVPPAIITAIKLMVGDLYQNRETVAVGQTAAVPMSVTVDGLLSPFRVFS